MVAMVTDVDLGNIEKKMLYFVFGHELNISILRISIWNLVHITGMKYRWYAVSLYNRYLSGCYGN